MGNISQILTSICLRQPSCRSSLAKSMNLNKSSITLIVKDLLDKKIIMEDSVGVASSRGGRKPVLLKINPSLGWVIGLYSEADRLYACSLNTAGEVMHSSSLVRCQSLDEDIQNITIKMMGLMERGAPLLAVLSGKDLNEKSALIESPESEGIRIPLVYTNQISCLSWEALFSNRPKQTENFLICHFEYVPKDCGIEVEGRVAVVINNTTYYGMQMSPIRFHMYVPFAPGVESFENPDKGTVNISNLEKPERFLSRCASHISVLISTFSLNRAMLSGSIGSALMREGELKEAVYRDFSEPVVLEEFNRSDAIPAYGAACKALSQYYETMEKNSHHHSFDFYQFAGILF